MRVKCIVPFCRRSTDQANRFVEPPDNVWICSDHWRTVPPLMKAARRRARKALRRDPAMLDRYLRLSRRVTRFVLERAGGIA